MSAPLGRRWPDDAAAGKQSGAGLGGAEAAAFAALASELRGLDWPPVRARTTGNRPPAAFRASPRASQRRGKSRGERARPKLSVLVSGLETLAGAS